MIYYLSELLSKLKTKKQFDDWVDKTAEELKKTIFNTRSTIYRKEVENELNDFRSLKSAYGHIRPLLKKEGYDLVIITDKQGYHSFSFRFPITKPQYDKCIEYRQSVIEELNKDGFKYGSSCIAVDEAVWTVLHEEIMKKFSFAKFFEGHTSIESVSGQTLIRKMDVARFKET